MNQKDDEFLSYIECYVTARPEVAAHISGYVARGIEASRLEQVAKSADMEIIVSFLLRSGKLTKSDRNFVVDKLEKWNHLSSLDWSSLINEFKDKK